MAYVLNFEDGRLLEIHIFVTTIPKYTEKISLYTENVSMELQSLYVALYKGVIQTFWLYNNTTVATKYTIKSENIEILCQKYGAKVLELLNPEGDLEPNRQFPIMIRFHPFESTIYAVGIYLFIRTYLPPTIKNNFQFKGKL